MEENRRIILEKSENRFLRGIKEEDKQGGCKRFLANLARTNFLPMYLPPDEIMELREVIRERIRLKKLSTSTKNKIHSILAKNGIKYEGNFFNSEGREFLNSLKLFKQ